MDSKEPRKRGRPRKNPLPADVSVKQEPVAPIMAQETDEVAQAEAIAAPARELMADGEIIAVITPAGVMLDTAESNKSHYRNEELLTEWTSSPNRAFMLFGFAEPNAMMSVSLAFIHGICKRFATSLSQNTEMEFTRQALPLDDEAALETLAGAPYIIGEEHLSKAWLCSFWDGLCDAFAKEMEKHPGSVREFLNAHDPKLNVVGRVYFHLVENKKDEEGKLPFAFLATYATKDAAAIAAAGKKVARGKSTHVPLGKAMAEFKSYDSLLKILDTLTKATDKSDFISSLLESGELFKPVGFKPVEAHTFLKEIPIYEECGILCRIPAWWKTKSRSISVSVALGSSGPSKVGLDALISCKPSLMFGGEEMSKEELEALLSQSSGLALIKGKWVEVDPEKLKEALAAYENALKMGNMSLAEALRLQLGLSSMEASEDSEMVCVSHGQWLMEIRNRMSNPEIIEAELPKEGFKASLRKYQEKGYAWLLSMKSLGFGALLADDMGLGKTVQILAMLEKLRQTGESFKCLLVVPASLISNWEKEIEKFSPNLSYKVLHPSFGKSDASWLKDANLFITTYGMILRLAYLKEVKWDLCILDEAQAIKNPGTKQTKAVKTLDAYFKVAMTGTPVENKLADLWSLFDFLNSGLLGNAKEFSQYAAKLKESGSYARLRETISPFILRRLKTDKSIISDLPDKIEVKDYPQLTKKQAALYKQKVDELKSVLQTAPNEGIQRQGLVLGSIIKFKQICNHPDQYLGMNDYSESASGKFEMLRAICETILEKRERVLVFTQFKEITEPLSQFLTGVFHRPGLVIHGETPVKTRSLHVDKFNSQDEYTPFMVLSLKAGGVGLNLTAANHVVHFDRWWNPAVENQATDRAFRIGQTKGVIVHKFITSGTIEEKIDLMIEEKLQLSGDLIESSGESWIAKMSNQELMNLFALK